MFLNRSRTEYYIYNIFNQAKKIAMHVHFIESGPNRRLFLVSINKAIISDKRSQLKIEILFLSRGTSDLENPARSFPMPLYYPDSCTDQGTTLAGTPVRHM